jgi:hypothetical protein
MSKTMSDERKPPECVSWALLGEWWCVPIDMNSQETYVMVNKIRDRLGSSFENCPSLYLEERLFGGFECAEDKERRHVYFSTGSFSFLVAERDEFWPLSPGDRRDVWRDLFKGNKPEHRLGDGPFTHDYPKIELEETDASVSDEDDL